MTEAAQFYSREYINRIFFAVQDSICPAGRMIDVHTRQWGQDVDEITQSSFSLHAFVLNIVPIR
jgi:hypothetical protein